MAALSKVCNVGTSLKSGIRYCSAIFLGQSSTNPPRSSQVKGRSKGAMKINVNADKHVTLKESYN